MIWVLLIYLFIGTVIEWAVSHEGAGSEWGPSRRQSMAIIFIWPVILVAAYLWRIQQS